MKNISDQFSLANFDFEAFERRYAGNDLSGLKALQKAMPPGTKSSDKLTEISQRFFKSDMDLCAGYVRSLLILNAIERRIENNPEMYRDICHKPLQELLETSISIETQETGNNVWKINKIVWALCQRNSPMAERHAMEHKSKDVLRGITFGMMLDYRQRKFAPETLPEFKADAYKRTVSASRAAMKNRAPLKRK